MSGHLRNAVAEQTTKGPQPTLVHAGAPEPARAAPSVQSELHGEVAGPGAEDSYRDKGEG